MRVILMFTFVATATVLFSETTNPFVDAVARFENAIRRNDISTLDKLIKKNPKLLSFRSDNQNNWLHFAVKAGNNFAAMFLIKNGISLQDQNLGGATPMHFAAQQCNKEILMLPVKSGMKFDYNLSNIEGSNILMTAISFRCNSEIIKFLIPYSNLSLKTSNGQSLRDIILYLPEKWKNEYLAIDEISALFQDE